MKLSFVLKWRCFPIIFLLCISRNSSFRFFKKSLFGSPFVLAKVRIALKTCKERPFLQAGNLILEMRSKTGQCHPVCHIDFSCSELHISRQSDDYPARRGFFNGYHPYNRGICSLWRTFQQHLFKVFRWDRGSSPEKRLGSKTGDSSLKEAKSKRRYLGARGRAFCVCDQNCGFSCKCTQQKPAMEMTCERSSYSPAKNTTRKRKILFNIVFIVLSWGKLPCRSGQRNIQSDRQILNVWPKYECSDKDCATFTPCQGIKLYTLYSKILGHTSMWVFQTADG